MDLDAPDYLTDPAALRRFLLLADNLVRTIVKQDAQFIQKVENRTATHDDYAFWAEARRDLLRSYEKQRSEVMKLYSGKTPEEQKSGRNPAA